MAVYDVRLDTISPALLYAGKALPGSSSAAAVWQIQRITIVGQETVVAWANGNGSFGNIWNDRLLLPYPSS